VQALVNSEFFMYKAAAKAGSRLPPGACFLQGVLPLLQFCVERDKKHVQKILNCKKGATRIDCDTINCMTEITLKEEASFENTTFLRAKVSYCNKTDSSFPEVNPHVMADWYCAHCARVIGNVYLRCEDCHVNNAGQLHYLCTDCFLAGRHFQKGKKWVNSERAHPCRKGEKERLTLYTLRFRLIKLGELAGVIDKCRNQLAKNKLKELPETKKTMEYLRKAHMEIESDHMKV